MTTKIRQVVQARGETTTCSGRAVISRKNIERCQQLVGYLKPSPGKRLSSKSNPYLTFAWGTKK